ncbi:hypothetical protein K8I61_16295 [bacterium]|nr:hypothetical protein [bacterium]
MSNAKHRREAIRRIIESNALATQHDIVHALSEQGIPSTQSSVSRDISYLGLVKAGGRYVVPAARTTSFTRGVPVPVLNVASADALAVVRVLPGQASSLGVYLDDAAWPEIVGTVAGDDTVVIACRDRHGRNSVLARLSGGMIDKDQPA